ncbi:hypothetical protein GUITHDRAFT_61650, partial [Guillardia theta CCMP2712]
LLCRVICAGINPCDAKFQIGDKVPHWARDVARMAMEGRAVGFDFSGVVVDAPPGCPGFSIGDSVFGTLPSGAGTLTHYVQAPMDQIAKKPTSLSFAEAGALPIVGLTAMQALVFDNHLSKSQRLLVIGGSGGVGHVAIQIARAIGAQVTSVCGPRNSKFVEALGAENIIDYTKGSDFILSELKRLTSLEGPFDLCLDTVSSNEEQDAVYQYRRLIMANNDGRRLVRGKYITIGGSTSEWARALVKKLVGMNLFGQQELFWVSFPGSRRALEQLKALTEAQQLRPTVSEIFPFEEEAVQTAFERLHSRRTVGKLVVQVSPN